MEVLDFPRAMIEVFDWFPCAFMTLISFPIDIILKLVVDNSRIEDFFDFIFIDIFDCNRGRWRLSTARNLICLIWFQQSRVEYWMYFHCSWKLEFECHFAFADDFEDFKRTETLVIEFSRGSCSCDIPSRKPYQVIDCEWRCFLMCSIVVFFLFLLGFL